MTAAGGAMEEARVFCRQAPRARKVMLFGDDARELSRWELELERAGMGGIAVASEEQAQTLLASGTFDAVVVGCAVPGELARAAGNFPVHTPLILVPAVFSAKIAIDLSSCADLILPGPLEPELLSRAVEIVTGADCIARFAAEHRLSPRETALLRVALMGMNNDEAAAELDCSRATISSFWNRIFRKTGVSGQRDVFIMLFKARGRRASTSSRSPSGVGLIASQS